MKKSSKSLTAILSVIILSLIVTNSYSQKRLFAKGQIDLQAGIGFISTLNVAINETGWGGAVKSKSTTPPISISVDYGITDEMSLGLYFAKSNSKIYGYGEEMERDQYTIVGIRGLYHLDLSPKFDIYGGAMLGLNSIKVSQPGVGGDSPIYGKASQIGYQFMAGGRYHFTKNVGAFLELGYGVAVVNMGLNVTL